MAREMKEVIIAIDAPAGTAQVWTMGNAVLDLFQQVLLGQWGVFVWNESTLGFQNGRNMRLILRYYKDDSAFGQVNITCHQSATAWVRTSPGGDPINGPPDFSVGVNQVSAIDAWGPTPEIEEAKLSLNSANLSLQKLTTLAAAEPLASRDKPPR